MTDRCSGIETKPSVILIHGLWMHGLVFLPQQRWLQQLGFRVHRFSYPSRTEGLEGNASLLARFISDLPDEPIHLVAHSLGGLVALAMLNQATDRQIGRVVMMGSPYAGSHCGSYLAASPLLSSILGRSMADWLASPPPAPPSQVEIGVIAGTHSWGLGRIIPGLPAPNDGVVTVEETCVPGAEDRIILPISHSGMLLSAACAKQAASFLRTGHFLHG